MAELSELRVFSLLVATEPWICTLALNRPKPYSTSADSDAEASVFSFAEKDDITSMSKVMSTVWMLRLGTLTMASSGTSSSPGVDLEEVCAAARVGWIGIKSDPALPASRDAAGPRTPGGQAAANRARQRTGPRAGRGLLG